MPIQINVPVTLKTQAPAIPSGMFVCFEFTVRHLDVYYSAKFYASKAAYNAGAPELDNNSVPDVFPKGVLQHTMTPAQYASTPDIIGILHTRFRNDLEAVIGNGNTSLVNYD